MMFSKEVRIVNLELLEQRRGEPCVACGREPAPAGSDLPRSEPDHISTRGSGGDDVPENVWSLCCDCHRLKGAGFEKFLDRYPKCVIWLHEHGRQDVFERLKRI